MAKPSAQQIRELLLCDAATGRLVWRARTASMFLGEGAQWRCDRWNKRFAGREAGHLNKSGTLKGYRTVRIFDHAYLEHHVVWLIVHGEWPASIDHRLGKEAGNGIANLRIASQMQNAQNSRKRSDNKSGFKGVSWDPINEKWVVRIRHPNGGKYENLGRFDNSEIGHQAYCQRAIELYGEFARFE